MFKSQAKQKRARPINKEGIFDNAVFSKIVRAVDDPEVRRGAAEDLKWITRKPADNNSHQWNHAPPESSGSDETLVPMGHPGRGLTFLRRNQFLGRRMNREATEHTADNNPFDIFDCAENEVVIPRKVRKSTAPQREARPTTPRGPQRSTARLPSPVQPSFDINEFSAIDERTLSSPLKTPTKRAEEREPSKIPEINMNEVVKKSMATLPQLPLRNGHSLTYGRLVTDLCRRGFQRSADKETIRDEFNTTIQEAARENKNLLDSLNITDPFNFNVSSESPESPETSSSRDRSASRSREGSATSPFDPDCSSFIADRSHSLSLSVQSFSSKSSMLSIHTPSSSNDLFSSLFSFDPELDVSSPGVSHLSDFVLRSTKKKETVVDLSVGMPPHFNYEEPPHTPEFKTPPSLLSPFNPETDDPFDFFSDANMDITD
ncbi:hypothetical protein M3Y94_00233000 [Aphelenchoides besseyi]|nr:hypothetical protein M3Y94_00233000 [Aphelenchoides besseyi]KAI6236421.1 hypothetical protein M3Y95_00155800 [Aphelenchoides besseyi]